MGKTVGVLLNAYKRLDILDIQLQAIINQTIKPKTIYIWNNSGEILNFDNYKGIPIIVANSSNNLGVWARFSFALNIKEDYIAIFDDDTIPSKLWFENCIEHMPENDYALMGTRGLRFLSKKSYIPYETYGWNSPNEELTQVDILGHAWFFERKLLGLYWAKYDVRYLDDFCGEDIHLSYSLQQAGINSYVPPHPVNDIDLWGSSPEYGDRIGTDTDAISQKADAIAKFDLALIHYVNLDFQLYYFKPENKFLNPAKILVKNDFRSSKFFALINKTPGLKKMFIILRSILMKFGIFFK